MGREGSIITGPPRAAQSKETGRAPAEARSEPEHGGRQDSAHHYEDEEFASRCEIYRTDPRVEKRKSRWVVELVFLTRP